jgi:hypothetical protein
MTKLHDEWTVFPHGAVERIDDGILSVEGEIVMPLGRFPRRMTVVALTGSRSVVFSPVCLNERAMGDIESLGTPAFMVVPNGFHRLDARPWKLRYPDIKVVCPPGARERVEKAVAVDATRDVLGDPDVDFVVADGQRPPSQGHRREHHGAAVRLRRAWPADGAGGPLVVRQGQGRAGEAAPRLGGHPPARATDRLSWRHHRRSTGGVARGSLDS